MVADDGRATVGTESRAGGVMMITMMAMNKGAPLESDA
jgi:hypothetical protein